MTTYESAAYASWENSWANEYEEDEEEDEEEECDEAYDEREEVLCHSRLDEERYYKWLKW